MQGTMNRVSRRAILAGLATGASWLGSVWADSIKPENWRGNEPEPDPADGEGVGVKGAARWLEQSQFIVSSLETGRVGYLEAWGGDEFGFAYTYAVSGQPDGVNVDTETGILSIATPLAVGAHRFQVIVANRRAATKVARFAVTLTVRQGVKENRVGDQILHKTYVADSGAHGRPRGHDYTQVLIN